MTQKCIPQQYDRLPLKELAEQLHLDYHNALAVMCAQADGRLHELKNADFHQTTYAYTDACSTVLEKTDLHIHYYRQQLLPYIKELYDKDAGGHDCAHCKGGCDIRHQSYLMQLHETHRELYGLLYELQTAALPLYSNLDYPVIYRSLRNEMLLIDAVLRELLYLEEAILIPQMLRSQKKINAYHL